MVAVEGFFGGAVVVVDFFACGTFDAGDGGLVAEGEEFFVDGAGGDFGES